MSHEKDSFFWPSYVDLMTGLFAIALILFVLSYVTVSRQKEQYRINADRFQRIREIEKSVEELQDSQYFEYEPDYKRHILKRQVQFGIGKSEIAPVYHEDLRNAGERILQLINKLKAEKNIRYLLIIEGMASSDRYGLNYQLSYERALNLFRLWQSQGIIFDPRYCEVHISGSGTGGLGRFEDEVKNQRFLIQIIPKIGN